jgi:20S proteasome alpha/beta subunit
MAIGARSQSARTYLEKNLDKFVDSNQDELIKHCMRALRDTLPNEVELTVKVNENSIVFNLENKKISLELCCCYCWKGYAICFIR